MGKVVVQWRGPSVIVYRPRIFKIQEKVASGSWQLVMTSAWLSHADTVYTMTEFTPDSVDAAKARRRRDDEEPSKTCQSNSIGGIRHHVVVWVTLQCSGEA